MLKALVFDFDGLILDTELPVYQSWKEVFESFDQTLKESFSWIRCGREAGDVKPAPDLYRSVVADMGIEVTEAVALEDSPIGIAAAKAAGLFCIAVPNEVTCHTNLDAADIQIPSLTELSIAKLRQINPAFQQ